MLTTEWNIIGGVATNYEIFWPIYSELSGFWEILACFHFTLSGWSIWTFLQVCGHHWLLIGIAYPAPNDTLYTHSLNRFQKRLLSFLWEVRQFKYLQEDRLGILELVQMNAQFCITELVMERRERDGKEMKMKPAASCLQLSEQARTVSGWFPRYYCLSGLQANEKGALWEFG